jgi:hypothetical protein
VRDVARGDRTRRKIIFFEKTKIENPKITKTKNQKVKSKKEILNLEKWIAEAKRPQCSQSTLNLPRVRPNVSQKSRAPAELWTFRVHLPVDASSFNEEIEPFFAGRTNLLKKVRCGLNLEQR